MHQNKYNGAKTSREVIGAELRNKLLYLAVILTIPVITFAYPFKYETCNLGWQHVYHDHNEESYQQAWCNAHNGIMEYENKDFTRVDCLTKTHAVEFDFANKWHESIGQALHYAVLTGKKAKVVLILDEPKTQMVYYKRIKKIGKKYKFDTEYVTNDILNLDKEGKCFNPKCKCNRDIHQNIMHQNIYTVV